MKLSSFIWSAAKHIHSGNADSKVATGRILTMIAGLSA